MDGPDLDYLMSEAGKLALVNTQPDTHTQKALKSCMCLSTRFLKPCHSALKRMVCTHGLTHIHKNALNPVCVSIL